MVTNIFISYSQKDSSLLAGLEEVLAPLLQERRVSLFIDRQLGAGDRWRQKILQALDRMDISILVITDNFLSSEFIREIELKAIRHYARNRRNIVIPLVFNACKKEIPGWVLTHQSPTDPKIPIAELSEEERTEVFYRLAERIRLFSFRDHFFRRLLRRRILNWRFSMSFLAISSMMLVTATLTTWRLVQPIAVQKIHSLAPTGFCRAEEVSSSVQLFERGWLLANFERDTFFAIGKQADARIRWIRINASGYTKGNEDACESVDGRENLKLGFRWYYCASEKADAVQALLGRPLTGEVRAHIQYQPWINGLLAYGLPGTNQGIEQDHFQVLNGVMIAGVGGEEGRGRYFGVTTGTASRNEYCTAAWYPALANHKTHPMQDGFVESGVCVRAVPAEFYREARLKCSLDGYDDSAFANFQKGLNAAYTSSADFISSVVSGEEKGKTER